MTNVDHNIGSSLKLIEKNNVLWYYKQMNFYFNTRFWVDACKLVTKWLVKSAEAGVY